MRIINVDKWTNAYKMAGHTDEMKKWYEQRTSRHIKLVGKYCEKISQEFPEFKELIERAKVHDNSKYESPEMAPYIWLTWKYKCKDDGKDFNSYDPPEDIDERMHEATEHHVLNNSHHPEYHCGKKEDVINRDNRDKPSGKVLDATKMPDLDIAEMCADWCAMSEEKSTDPKEWADKNINKRWKFTDEQSRLIYKLIESVWK